MKYFEMGLIKNYTYSRFHHEYNYALTLSLFNLHNYFYMTYWFVYRITVMDFIKIIFENN